MISAELLVIFVVAIIVFGPGKLPMLAEHLGKLFRQIHLLKQKTNALWQAQLNEQQLLENQRKASKADAGYNETNQE